MTEALPHGACDCHAHVFGPRARFPLIEAPDYDPPEAPLAAYLALLDRLGLDRGVAVQAGVYGTDNAALVDALEGAQGRLRGVAVVDADVDEVELERLHAAGVRGVRVAARRMPAIAFDRLLPLAQRIEPHGWHLQLLIDPPHLLALARDLARLPVPVVIDHLARMWLAGPLAAATEAALFRLLQGGSWVKVSNAHRVGEGAADLVRRVVEANPGRILWGTDWPHPAEMPHVPNDADLLRLFLAAVPDPATRRRILVDNPEALFGFTATGEETS